MAISMDTRQSVKNALLASMMCRDRANVELETRERARVQNGKRCRVWDWEITESDEGEDCYTWMTSLAKHFEPSRKLSRRPYHNAAAVVSDPKNPGRPTIS